MAHFQVEGLKYPHRTNPDGTIDSICPRCYITVGTSSWESELERMEAAHVCDARRVDYFERQVRATKKNDGAGAEEHQLRAPKVTEG